MPGIRVLASNELGCINEFWSFISQAVRIKETNSLDLCQTKNVRIGITYLDFYPFNVINDAFFSIIIDGLVYSPDAATSETYLRSIASKLVEGEDVLSLVRDFVETADGDFVIIILDKKSQRLIAFNDRLGRLAVYYYSDNQRAVISREIKSILAILDAAEKDKYALIEYLSLGYPLGKKTLFKEIKRLAPSEMLFLDIFKSGNNLSIRKTCDFNFCLEDPFNTVESSLDILTHQYLEAVEKRVDCANRSGHPIVSDLSGGFDTRAILGGLSHFSKDVQYITIKLATGDETMEAELAFNALGKPGRFSAIQVNHEYSEEDIGQYLLDTDGLVNYYTTIVCSKDIDALYSEIDNASAFRFCGLGGEFIRHPNKKYFRSILDGYKRELYSGSVSRICNLLSVNPKDYYDSVADYLSSYPEKTPHDQLKRWYYEYYLNFVDHAAEDRERSVIWTVQPLWSNLFTKTIFNKIPLNWTGYEYFTRFLEKIDERLLKAPIFRKDLVLDSKENLREYDKKEAWKLTKRTIKSAFPVLGKIKKFYRSLRPAPNALGYKLADEFSELVIRRPAGSNICDVTACKRSLAKAGDNIFFRRLKTLIIYFDELKKNTLP